MLQTRLWRSINCLSAHEMNGFGKFLRSPYFNQRADLCQLFEAIKEAIAKEKVLTKSELWTTIFPSDTFVEQKLRLLMTYLQRLLEQFITVEKVMGNKISIKLETAAWYRTKGIEKLHNSTLKDSIVQSQKQPLRNAE
ncbi:MAG: hypothetical protein AAGD05_01865 [Bacteroidota bacterium]